MTELTILYHDDALIAINKPGGLLVHRSLIDRHETRFALQMLRDQIGQRVYPLHRLDKPTSGVLLFALSAELAQRMGEQFTAGQVQKRYLAVVRGNTDAQGHIDYPLKEELDRIADARARTDKAGQAAITDYQRLSICELPIPVGRYATARYSLLALQPRTGRKHQLRRHMKHIFHPIVGDTTHGDGKHNRLFREHFDCHRLLLHCERLTVSHPDGGQPVSIHAPLDKTFSDVMKLTGL